MPTPWPSRVQSCASGARSSTQAAALAEEGRNSIRTPRDKAGRARVEVALYFRDERIARRGAGFSCQVAGPRHARKSVQGSSPWNPSSCHFVERRARPVDTTGFPEPLEQVPCPVEWRSEIHSDRIERLFRPAWAVAREAHPSFRDAATATLAPM